MSYYECDPNYYEYYCYDDYPDYDVVYEDPCLEYRRKKKKKHTKHTILAKHIDFTLSDENIPKYYYCDGRRYVVPVVYAPKKVSTTKSFKESTNGHIQENIDAYYSDKRNIQKEATFFQNVAQPYYYASTIQEETETSPYIDTCSQRDDTEDTINERSITITTKQGNKMEIPEKWEDCNPKKIVESFKKMKKKSRGEQNKRTEKTDKPSQCDKPETSNSWITLQSGSCVTNKEVKNAEIQKQINKNIPDNLPENKSTSPVVIPEKPNINVTSNVNNDDTEKNANKDSHHNSRTEFKVVKETDKTTNVNMNSNYQSMCNVQSMAGSVTKSKEVVGWKNKTMQQESSTETSKLSCKSSPTIPDTSEYTDITINTEEYKEFIDTINKKPIIESQHRAVTFQQNSNKSEYQNANISNDEQRKKLFEVNIGDSNQTFLERVIKAKPIDDHQYKKRINPILEAPLSLSCLSNNKVYIPAYLLSDFPVAKNEDVEKRVSSRKKSLFVKIFRTVADLIACVQNIAYKYVFRFILFI